MFSKSKINEPGPKATDTDTAKGADATKPAGTDFKASAPKPKPPASVLSSDLLITGNLKTSGDIQVEGGNPTRTEDNTEARRLDVRLRQLWSKHSNFCFVPHSTSFFAKLQQGLAELQKLVAANGLFHPDS